MQADRLPAKTDEEQQQHQIEEGRHQIGSASSDEQRGQARCASLQGSRSLSRYSMLRLGEVPVEDWSISPAP